MGLFRSIFGLGVEPVVSTQTVRVEGPLELRDGHPVLTDEMRTKLERAGADPAQIEAQLAATRVPGGSSQSVSIDFSSSASICDRSGHTIGLHGGLEMQRGRPVMNEELRAELESHGIDPAVVEAQFGNARTERAHWHASYSPSGELRSCSFSENGARGTFEIVGGRLALSEASRAELAQQGVDVDRFEASFHSRVSVNEEGELVSPGSSSAVAGSSQPETQPAKPFYRKPSEEDLLRGSEPPRGG